MQIILDITLMLLVFEIACAVYIPSLMGEFVFDDMLIVERTEYTYHRRTGTDWKSLWRLLTFYRAKRALLYWTFRRDMLIHGRKDVIGWHVMNILIHGINSAQMYIIARSLFDMPYAFTAAAAFAVYPLSASSVASISGRSSSLCQMFNLASLLSFICGAWYLIPLWFYLGMKSKEEIVMLPATLYLWWLLI